MNTHYSPSALSCHDSRLLQGCSLLVTAQTAAQNVGASYEGAHSATELFNAAVNEFGDVFNEAEAIAGTVRWLPFDAL